MTTSLPDSHPLLLGQKILNFLQEKGDYNEHIIDEVINGYEKDAIINAIYELAVIDLVQFPNNDPSTYSQFLNAGEVAEPPTINYPVIAQRIDKN
jgi:hypothetical protein